MTKIKSLNYINDLTKYKTSAFSRKKKKIWNKSHVLFWDINFHVCMLYVSVTRNLNVKFSKKIKLNNLEFKSNPTKCTVQIQPNIYN